MYNYGNKYKKMRLFHNDNPNKLDHIYLMRLKSSIALYVKEAIRVSSGHLKDLGRFLLNYVKNPFLSERSELKGFSNTIKIALSLS